MTGSTRLIPNGVPQGSILGPTGPIYTKTQSKFHSYAIKFRQSKDRPLLGDSDSKKLIHPLVLSKPGFCNAALTVRPN